MNPTALRTAAAVMLLFLASCGLKTPPRLPEPERPPAPVNLAAVHREAEVVLTWDYPGRRPGMLREFRVYRSGDLLARTSGQSYADADIAVGSTYEYVVAAVGADGVPGEGASVRVSPVAVPAKPEALSAEVVPGGVRLSWRHPEEEVAFNVYRSGRSGIYALRPINAEPVTGTTFDDNPLMNGPVYYTVRAMRGGPSRDEGPASAEVVLSPGDFVPSAPASLRAVRSGDVVLLAWRPSPEIWVRAYRLYRALRGEEFRLLGESRTPSFIDAEAAAGPRSYRVRALGPSAEGPPSEAVTVPAD